MVSGDAAAGTRDVAAGTGQGGARAVLIPANNQLPVICKKGPGFSKSTTALPPVWEPLIRFASCNVLSSSTPNQLFNDTKQFACRCVYVDDELDNIKV